MIDTGELAVALDNLRRAGWAAHPWDTLLDSGPALSCPTRPPQSLASVFYTSGTTGPSKGVAMPHAQMYMFGSRSSSPSPALTSARYLPRRDTAVPRERAVHGRLPGSDRGRPGGDAVTVQREQVGPPAAGEPGHRDKHDRRHDGLHLEATASAPEQAGQRPALSAACTRRPRPSRCCRSS